MSSIAFFMHNFNGGGAEKVTITLANELVSKGYNVKFIVRDNSGVLEKCIRSEIEIINLNLTQKSKIIKNFKNIKLLKKIINSKEIDIMISITAPMNLIASISNSLAKNRVRLFATVHNAISMEKKSFNFLRHKLLRFYDKYIEKTIIVSKEAENDYIKTIKINSDKTITIYNPVVSENIKSLSEEEIEHKWLVKERDYTTILAIGRLTEQKNFEMLLNSIRIVSDTRNVRLIILGEGELREKLKMQATKLKIDNLVDFYGFTHNPYSFLARCDIYALSSKWEGLPTVLIEALACGCKIVSTDCKTGPKEILDNGRYGILTKIDDEIEFSKAIIKAIDLKVNKNEIKDRAKLFSVEKSVSEYVNLINKV